MSLAWTVKGKAAALKKGCTCHYGEDSVARWFVVTMNCPAHAAPAQRSGEDA
jgi:hypothetical protein